jgi:hypothetical protein
VTIKAVHIQEMRNALGAAYTAHSLSGPTYTNPTLTAQSSVVGKVHIDELRANVEYLEEH